MKRLAFIVLAPRLTWLMRHARVVVIPNDAVFPYVDLIALAKRLGKRVVLMQEGIRFPFPAGYGGPPYGSGPADAICVWGEGSREYFLSTGASRESLRVTGAPRMDSLVPSEWRQHGGRLRDELGLTARPIAFVSNPIEIQGYGTKALRLQLFERLVGAAIPVLASRRISMVVKTHAYEDRDEYAAIAARSARPDLIHVLPSMAIFPVLAAACAVIVLSSTVGLEALVFGLPVGVLEIPNFGYPFEYVQQSAALALSETDLSGRLEALLARAPSAGDRAFVDRHFFERGSAARNVADVVERLLEDAPASGTLR